MSFSQELYEDYAAVYLNVLEELRPTPGDAPEDEPINDDYELVAYNKFKINFEYIVELLQGFVDFLDQSEEDFDSVEFDKKLLVLREIVREFSESNSGLGRLLMYVLSEIEKDKKKYLGQDISVIINQMRYAAVDKEICDFADKWFIDAEDVKYEAYNYKDGEIANENKLKENANYAAYKTSVENPMPKFKFNGALIKSFKEELMPEISSLL